MTLAQLLSNLKINALNPMQTAATEAVKENESVVLISPTGSGKTLAFLLPLVNRLDADRKDVQALIIVPTRELAQQIEQVFKQMASGFKINCCYGGHSVQVERNNFSEAPAVLVGTPGRLAHHIRKETISFATTSTLVLDEFDKSLEAGFEEEMSFIIKTMRRLQKRILTSATALSEIPAFAGVKEFKELDFNPELQNTSQLKLKSVKTASYDKQEALMLLLGAIGSKPVIVFCNHRDAVNRISEQLDRLKIEHGFYHGGLEQTDREKTLIKLRNGSINILVSTDLAARGLDIPEIASVVHYQMPGTEDVMIHRNGRTARMNADGSAYFLLEQEDYLPPFLKETPEDMKLPSKMMTPESPRFKTLYISAGKKDKVNKMDIVGMLLQKGGLKKEDLGKIEVLDHSAFVAIKTDKIHKALATVREERIKNKKVKMEVAN